MVEKKIKEKKKSIEELKLENKASIKTTALIVIGFLGFINLIGIYFGKDGFVTLGVVLFIGLIFSIMILVGSGD